MKKCRICKNDKPEDDFYSGHARCKGCYIKVVKEYRFENIDKIREYDKGRANIPKRVEARLRYSKSEVGKLSSTKAKAAWSNTNLIKRAASITVGNAVRDGKLVKPTSCADCGSAAEIIHGHHDDYAYPMTVRWLCSKCHRLWHKTNGQGVNG
jgi:ribosomal protein S27AE